ncbi:HGH1 [Cordylochernes scorpioides]|uniref:Protein HGH1 homolog n=1 Tax=Cordylochernes scorpioides TaxID=51811 RepID=A0ABY6KSY5_9ARAC|nr:HGH1 [Cordylochernes scorpioides]
MLEPCFSDFHSQVGLDSCNNQVSGCLRLLLDNKFLQRMLPLLLQPSGTIGHLEAIVGTLRNCCFETDCAKDLIEADIARYLIHPLAGPGEYREHELPEDLLMQYSSKTREPSPALRKMLVEALIQLGATEEGRIYLRQAPVYPVLRETHKWEMDRPTAVAINNLVTLLIGEEQGTNLKELDIPSELQDQFAQWDKEDLAIK